MLPAPSHLGPGAVGDAQGTQGPRPAPARPWRGRGGTRNPTAAAAVLRSRPCAAAREGRNRAPGVPPPKHGSGGARCCTSLPRGLAGTVTWHREGAAAGRAVLGAPPAARRRAEVAESLRSGWRRCGPLPLSCLYFFLHRRLPLPFRLSGRSGT